MTLFWRILPLFQYSYRFHLRYLHPRRFLQKQRAFHSLEYGKKLRRPSSFQRRSMKREGEILESLLTYQVLYGDMLVPANYVVPNDKICWSPSLWGIQLGSLVQMIRNKAVHLNMKQCLVKMGFDYTEQQLNYQKGESACLYNPAKELKLHEVFSNHDTCPEHIRWIKEYRSKGATLQDKIFKIVEELVTTIPEKREIEYSYDKVKEALLRYKAQNGNMLVPIKYLTLSSDPDNPGQHRTMKLGHLVQEIRKSNKFVEHREELEKIGFDFEKQIGDFDLLREALLVYKSIYGDLMVPLKYKIAGDDKRYPTKARGKALGSSVIAIRGGVLYVNYKAQLEEIGFCYDKNTNQFYNFIQVKEALLTYKTLQGNLTVPAAYIIKEDDVRYPENVRGMKLGNVMNSVRNQGAYADHREELKAMGFLYDQQIRVSTFAEVKEALLTYKTLHGHLKVPTAYIIAEGDVQYPENVRGIKLGIVVGGIRNKGHYSDHRDELEAMGFIYDRQRASHAFASLKEALLTYKALYGHLKVPTAYVIAKDDTRYPENMRGVKLGSTVSTIRNKGCYADHREELKAMGVLYNHSV